MLSLFIRRVYKRERSHHTTTGQPSVVNLATLNTTVCSLRTFKRLLWTQEVYIVRFMFKDQVLSRQFPYSNCWYLLCISPSLQLSVPSGPALCSTTRIGQNELNALRVILVARTPLKVKVLLPQVIIARLFRTCGVIPHWLPWMVLDSLLKRLSTVVLWYFRCSCLRLSSKWYVFFMMC